MQHPAFRRTTDESGYTNHQTAEVAHEPCAKRTHPAQLEQLMSFSGNLQSFSDGTDKLHSELCRYKALIDTTKLEIQRHVADIQSIFARSICPQKKMYEALMRPPRHENLT